MGHHPLVTASLSLLKLLYPSLWEDSRGQGSQSRLLGLEAFTLHNFTLAREPPGLVYGSPQEHCPQPTVTLQFFLHSLCALFIATHPSSKICIAKNLNGGRQGGLAKAPGDNGRIGKLYNWETDSCMLSSDFHLLTVPCVCAYMCTQLSAYVYLYTRVYVCTYNPPPQRRTRCDG